MADVVTMQCDELNKGMNVKGLTMNSTTTKSNKLQEAVVIGDEAIRRCVEFLNDFSQELEYSISCSDGSSITYASPDELLRYPNSKNRKIVSLSIKTPWKSQTNFRVRFGCDRTYSIDYDISGEDKNVIYASDKLEDFILTIRQWYSKIAFTDFIFFMFGFVVVGCLYFTLPSMIKLFHATEIQSGTSIAILTARSFIIGLLIPVAAGFIGFILNKIRSQLFPKAVFALGDGKKRLETLIFIRRTLMVSIILAFSVGVVVNLITTFITK